MSIELCVPSWSFRTAFANKELNLVKAAKRVVKELAIEYIDIFDSHFHSEKDLMEIEVREQHNHAEMLRKEFDKLGVKVAGISAANDFSMEETASLDVERSKRWIEICPILGARFVRINTGRHWMERKDESVHFAVDRLRQNLEPLLNSARSNHVILVLENHPLDIPTGEIGQQYIKSMREVIEPNPDVLAICADDGHIAWDTPEEWKQSCGELLTRKPLSEVKYMHTKCGKFAFWKEEWPATWKERVSLWYEKNYDSFIAMEYVDTGDAWAELRKVINSIVEAL